MITLQVVIKTAAEIKGPSQINVAKTHLYCIGVFTAVLFPKSQRDCVN